jgi:hypothetical protein
MEGGYRQINMDSLRIHWDKDYGINKRTGWSVSVNGHFVVEFKKFLIVAIFKSIKNHFKYR